MHKSNPFRKKNSFNFKINLETYCKYLGTTVEAFKETLKPQATKDVKLKLALEYIAKTENITATDEDINAKIDELAKEYGNENADSLKNNENIKKYMSERVLQDKTLKVVLDNVVVK